jgi:hypothetical protein
MYVKGWMICLKEPTYGVVLRRPGLPTKDPCSAGVLVFRLEGVEVSHPA